MMTRAARRQQDILDKLGEPRELFLSGGCRVYAPGLRAYVLATHNAINLCDADVAVLASALNDEAFPATLAAACASKPANDNDPITGEPPSPPLFYSGPNQFSAAALAEYFKTTGKVTNPFTNVEFDAAEVATLGVLAGEQALMAVILNKKQELEQAAGLEGLLDVLSNDFALCIDAAIQSALEEGGFSAGELYDTGTTLYQAGGEPLSEGVRWGQC